MGAGPPRFLRRARGGPASLPRADHRLSAAGEQTVVSITTIPTLHVRPTRATVRPPVRPPAGPSTRRTSRRNSPAIGSSSCASTPCANGAGRASHGGTLTTAMPPPATSAGPPDRWPDRASPMPATVAPRPPAHTCAAIAPTPTPPACRRSRLRARALRGAGDRRAAAHQAAAHQGVPGGVAASARFSGRAAGPGPAAVLRRRRCRSWS